MSDQTFDEALLNRDAERLTPADCDELAKAMLRDGFRLPMWWPEVRATAARLASYEQAERETHERIRTMLEHIAGFPGVCRGCGRSIWWVTHVNGRTAPYTEEALNHFVDCPERDQFRKTRKGGG